MKHFTAFIIPGLLLTLLSCSSPEPSKKGDRLPSDSIIPEKKMMSILVDVHLLEGGLMMQRNKGEQDRKWSEEAYKKLFLKYHVRQSQFVRNLTYYLRDPVSFTRIYDTVLHRIDRLKTQPKEKK